MNAHHRARLAELVMEDGLRCECHHVERSSSLKHCTKPALWRLQFVTVHPRTGTSTTHIEKRCLAHIACLDSPGSHDFKIWHAVTGDYIDLRDLTYGDCTQAFSERLRELGRRRRVPV